MFLFNWLKPNVTRLVIGADVQLKIVLGIKESRLVPLSAEEIAAVLATTQANCLGALLTWNRKQDSRWSFRLQMTTDVDSEVFVTLTLRATPQEMGLRSGAEKSLQLAVEAVIESLNCEVRDNNLKCWIRFNDSSEERATLHPRGIVGGGGA